MRYATLTLLACLAGCGAELDTKLGAENEPCLVDTDCRTEFLCVDGTCGDTACTEVCGHITGACEIEVPDCPMACRSATADFTPERRDDYVSCVTTSTCRQLRGAPLTFCAHHDCDAVCGRLAECGLETYETCAASCEDNTRGWTRATFNDFESCFFRLDCSDLDTQADACFPD